MTPPTERRAAPDATSASSAVSGVDETAAATSTDGTAAGGFGPPAGPGEVGTLGPYRVVKELGKGGMGAVYAAVDTRLDRRLALKVMLPQFAADSASRERFLREARAAARVKHDNVVIVYEADERSGVPYIAMEYLEGYPLDEYLKKKGNPTPAQAVRIAGEAAAGLAAAHRQGLVHRDIKPGNLWLEAPTGRVKVLDFGLARPVDAEVELTKSGAIVGTPAYMSPEQARGEKVDSRTDLFSLGAVLYRLVTGRLPFQGPNTMAVLIALGTEEPPPVRELNPEVPVALADLIHQLLSKVPANRPASADEVVKRLRALVQAQTAARARAMEQSTAQPQVIPSVVGVPIPVTAQTANPFENLDATEFVPAPAAVRAAPKRTWAVAAGLAALVLMVFGGVVIIIRNRDGTETKIEVPDGATVTVKGKDGKTLATVGPKVTPAADNSADRKAAEWVLSVGGNVRVNDDPKVLDAAVGLPTGRFTLTKCELAENKRVTDEGLKALKGCTGLKYLNLCRTNVTNAGTASLSECTSLIVLNLEATQVTDAGMGAFKDCTELMFLYFGQTGVTDASLAPLKDYAKLKVLGLSHTNVTDAGLVLIGSYPVLSELNLHGTRVTDAGLKSLKGCKKLAGLNLDDTRVSDAGVATIKSLSELTQLRLAKTAVTDASLTHLSECKSLTFLDVKSAKVTAKGLADFHAAVPGCRIEHDGGVIEAVDVDRRAAEWVLSIGGTVRADDQVPHLVAPADLPREPFVLTGVFVAGKAVADADLARLAGLRRLRILECHNTPLTDAGFAHLKNSTTLNAVAIAGTKVTDIGLAHLKNNRELQYLHAEETGVTDAGLTTVREFPHLLRLGLRLTAVTDAGLAHLAGLTELQSVNLHDTKVTDTGLARLYGCAALTRLNVRGTKVTAAGLARFHAAVPGCRIEHDGGVIEAVDVDRKAAEYVLSVGGRVTGTGFADWARLAADLPRDRFILTQAVIEKTATDAGLAPFRGCRGLTYINLSQSKVTDAGLEHFRNCTELGNATLAGTAITDAGLAYLRGCAKLHELNVVGTGVTGSGLADLRECKTLRLLNAGQTKFNDAAMAHLPAFPELAFLTLSDTPMTDAGMAHLKGHPGLRELAVFGTKVGDAGLAHLTDCPKLAILHLDGLVVTDAGLDHLARCKGLTAVNVTKTKVTAAGLARFHAAVPGCRVTHDGGVIEPRK